MINKEQLLNISRQTGLDLYQQEKDYLLKLFLYFYYQHYQEAIFKGGTCLKYVLSLPRFSEDLDFNINNSKSFQEQVKSVLKRMENLGISSYFIKEELFEESYTCELGFKGPLFTGTSQTQNRFRIDAGYRTGTFKKPEWKIIHSEYAEIPENFLVKVMDLQEIMAEKIITLFQRKKGRDFYDLWFLINAKVLLDRKLLEKKLKKEQVKLDFKNLIDKNTYERDMSRLTNRMIPYEQVKKEVMGLLEKE